MTASVHTQGGHSHILQIKSIIMSAIMKNENIKNKLHYLKKDKI